MDWFFSITTHGMQLAVLILGCLMWLGVIFMIALALVTDRMFGEMFNDSPLIYKDDE